MNIMKRNVFMMIAFLMAICAQAQVLRVAPQSNAKQLSRKVVKKTIAPTETQMWWGYFTGNEDITWIGTGRAETFDCAIFVPANHSIVGASTIKAVRFYMDNVPNVSMAKVWISKNLPADIDAADYVQNVAVSLENGANDIELTTPFATNDQAIYVGYSFALEEVDYNICIGGDDVDNSIFLRSSVSVPNWEAVSGFGRLALQLLVEGGTYPSDKATPVDFGSVVVGLGKSVDVPVSIKNYGKDPITSISYTISSEDKTTEEKTISVDAIYYSATIPVNIPFDADETEGTVNKTLTITKINGKANTASVKTATGSLTTLENYVTWPRTVLLEEFTTERCGVCPYAASVLSSFMTNNPDLASRVAIACHHSGYYTDWLTINASSRYTWFYNDNGSMYAPAFMYDRYAWNGKTPVEGLNEPGFASRVESRIAVPSNVGITLKANFNNDKSKVFVTAINERCWEFTTAPVRITLFLTEDNIEAQSQAGASGSFTHQHVLRAVNETWGAELTWTNNKAKYRYSFDLDSSWKTDDLKVVAFISGYDSSNPTNCTVENAAVCTVGEAIEEIKGDADGDGSFNVDDVTAAVSHLLGQKAAGYFSETAADMDESGTVDIVDIIQMIEAIKAQKQ